MIRTSSTAILIALGLACTANAAFVGSFDDDFTGGVNTGPFTTVGNSFASTATTASSDVSDYKVDINKARLLDNNAPVGNPAPALEFFGGQTQATDSTVGLHLNLTTVSGATYRVQLQSAMWGSTAGNRNYVLNTSAFDGSDTTSGTALGSDQINATLNSGFTVRTIDFTFVASSTSTTLYLDGTIEETLNHNAWADNLNIDEDLSTVSVPEPASLAMGLVGMGLLIAERRRK